MSAFALITAVLAIIIIMGGCFSWLVGPYVYGEINNEQVRQLKEMGYDVYICTTETSGSGGKAGGGKRIVNIAIPHGSGNMPVRFGEDCAVR
jgi:hypothetical protein